MTITVAIADDQALVRAGLRMIIDAADDLDLVAEAADGQEAVEVGRRSHPQVMLLDIRMPRLDGIEATRQLTALVDRPPRVVILTTFDHDDYLYGALRAGASGFLLKDAEPEQLTEAVRTVAAGESLLAPSVTTRLIAAVTRNLSVPVRPVPDEVATLTPREREILGLLARGLSNAEIARDLVLSVATVKTHVTGVLTKLQLRDRVQAVVLAYETGLVLPGPITHPR